MKKKSDNDDKNENDESKSNEKNWCEDIVSQIQRKVHFNNAVESIND